LRACVDTGYRHSASSQSVCFARSEAVPWARRKKTAEDPMSLPLLERAKEDSFPFVLTPKKSRSERLYNIAVPEVESPAWTRALQPGEQYRFHFDMTKCIGCKCCVVACNEQNGNPSTINWRRVGEIEGGWYPNTKRFYLSMGCNHCLEPSCLLGCPVDAYSKDPVTGIVRHSADTCIGCQYCTWNCSYGVPQFNPERGVVGKCDMCYGRLQESQAPACVNACPESAIQIEIINTDQWRHEFATGANAPGLPSADHSLSTTRVTLPSDIPPDTKKADIHRVRPEHPHWPLVVMTILTQLSVGAFANLWIRQLLGRSSRLGLAALASLFVGGLALAASTLHLGRPVHAYRALKMWKRSWLSREVLVFGGFSNIAFLYAALLVLEWPGSLPAGGFTALLGIAGLTCTARIYMVRPRPAWNTNHTLLEFYLSALLLGSLFVRAIGVVNDRWTLAVIIAAAAGQLANQSLKFFRLVRSRSFERQASARLLSTTLAPVVLWRGALLIAGGMLLPLYATGTVAAIAALLVSLGGEILGRYLFFVSVVPKNIALSYLAPGREAA